MKKNVFLIMLVAILFSGCLRQAEVVTMNIAKQADAFNVQRRITVINTRDSSVLFTIEGTMSLKEEDGDMAVLVQDGSNYKKHLIYLRNQWITYILEDISGTMTDPTRYIITVYAKQPVLSLNYGE